jgi:two-component system chemotaxis response regulator CheB
MESRAAGHDIIAIGGSLGAVDALGYLCAHFPANLPAAVLVVIHVGSRGNNLLAEIFDRNSALSVRTASDGEPVHPRHVYVAPADHHLLTIDGIIRLGRGPRENMARPAIDPLFRSVAVGYGARAIGLVLTGMLDDGAAGLADINRCGGLTVVQNPDNAPAPDMPLEALKSTDVDYRADLGDLPPLLHKLALEPAAPSPQIPDEIRLEVDIAQGRLAGPGEVMAIADPVQLSCPACGGVLSQIRRRPLRFRCQVGHGYTAESLAAASEGSTDEALRVALRILEERMVLTQKIADEARHSGRNAAAMAYERRAEECRRNAEILYRALSREEA